MCNDHVAAESPGELGRPFGRRGFLRSGALAAAAVGVTGTVAAPAAGAAQLAGGSGLAGHRRVPPGRISIQLYTLRDILAADPAGTLATLADIGYTRVEAAGTAGLTPDQFRALLDANGIRATSGHFGIPQPFDAAAWQETLAVARTLGCTYVVHPFFGVGPSGPIRDAAVWRNFALDLNKAGAMARRAGFEFGYHNHHFEFLRVDDGSGRRAWDILTATADPRLVHIELDIYWAWRGAADPVDLLRTHRSRIKQFHVKDMDIESDFADPGTGLIDFARVFAANAQFGGVKEFIVERDNAGTGDREPADALDTARVGYEFLRTIRF